jgi:hypothetical protein
LTETKQLLESDAKIELLRRQIRLLQAGKAAVALHVRRKHLSQDALEAFRSMQPEAGGH